MELQANEKVEVENLLKLIRRAKFDDFAGLEALALARAYSWLNTLLNPKPNVTPITTPQMPEKKPIEPNVSVIQPKKRGSKNAIK